MIERNFLSKSAYRKKPTTTKPKNNAKIQIELMMIVEEIEAAVVLVSQFC